MDTVLQKQILRGIWVFLAAAAIAVILYYAVPLVYPFLFGLLIAYLQNPLVGFLQRRLGAPRWLAVVLSLTFVIGAGLGLLTLLVTNMIFEMGSISESIQAHINNWVIQIVRLVNSEAIQNIVGSLNQFYSENPQYQDTINNNLSETAHRVTALGTGIVGSVLDWFVQLVKSLPSIATITIIAMLAAFFISKDWSGLWAWSSSLIPEKAKRTGLFVWMDLQKALFGYIRAQLILISLTTVVVLIGFIVLGVNYALTLALLTGLCDLMPYFGPGIVLVPWIILEFIQGNLYLGIGLSILYGIIFITRQIVEPKVLATSIGLNPLATLIAMFVGLKLFGVLGLILGPVSLILLAAFQRANIFRDLRNYILNGPPAAP